MDISPKEKQVLVNAISCRKRELQHILSYSEMTHGERLAVVESYKTLVGFEERLVSGEDNA